MPSPRPIPGTASRGSLPLLTLAGLLLAPAAGRAQPAASALSGLPERTFSQAATERCKQAHDILVAPPGSHFPRERLAAMEQYRWCLTAARVDEGATAPAVVPAGRPTEADRQALAAEARAAAVRSDLQVIGAAAPAAQAGESFLGISFGVGVGVSVAADDIVSEAALGPGNTVVAVKRARQLPRVILETHYYGWCASRACKEGRFGWGPYLAVVAKSDKLISAFSAGLMFGWRNPASPESAGFSIGIGPILDDGVSSLASGFKPGRPLPPGETAIRYEEKARWSLLLFGSRTF